MGVAGASAMASCLSLGVMNEIKEIDLNRTSFTTEESFHRQPDLRRWNQKDKSGFHELSQP